MTFTDVTFYTDTFLAGRSELIPLTEFDYWARKASDRINWRRIEFEPDEVPEILKMCTCEVAEAMYLDSEKKFMAMEPSQTVGSYSKGSVNVKHEAGELNYEIDEIIWRNLASTNWHNAFVFRGA